MTEADFKRIEAAIDKRIAKVPVMVWSYKNAKYENRDAYRILRDVRDEVVGAPTGLKVDTSAAKPGRVQKLIELVQKLIELVKGHIKQL